jgi:hypothetical protein
VDVLRTPEELVGSRDELSSECGLAGSIRPSQKDREPSRKQCPTNDPPRLRHGGGGLSDGGLEPLEFPQPSASGDELGIGRDPSQACFRDAPSDVASEATPKGIAVGRRVIFGESRDPLPTMQVRLRPFEEALPAEISGPDGRGDEDL